MKWIFEKRVALNEAWSRNSSSTVYNLACCFQPKQPKRSKSWFKHFQYNPKRDKAGDVRNILLIVATLIAAVTFQSGVNPPGGVWQDDDFGHEPGRAIYASRKEDYYVFLFFNTLALSSSVLVIMCLTYAFPFYIEILVATASMLVTYGSAIFAVTPAVFVSSTAAFTATPVHQRPLPCRHHRFRISDQTTDSIIGKYSLRSAVL
uniref:PGG domain-containing protein n=1 Tax=Quercus lobata TaxID=97700 RepID=A0A7N2LE20_QUELO